MRSQGVSLLPTARCTCARACRISRPRWFLFLSLAGNRLLRRIFPSCRIDGAVRANRHCGSWPRGEINCVVQIPITTAESFRDLTRLWSEGENWPAATPRRAAAGQRRVKPIAYKIAPGIWMSFDSLVRRASRAISIHFEIVIAESPATLLTFFHSNDLLTATNILGIIQIALGTC